MAITENSFTDAEFITAIEANPALVASVKTALGSKKFVVQDETEHQEFIKNFKDETFKKQVIDEHTSTFAPKLEADVFAQTGIAKKENEKWYDYQKRAMTESLGTVKQIKAELETLKAGHNPSEIDKARIKELEEGLVAKETEWKGKYEGLESKVATERNSLRVEAAISKLRPKYKAGLPESLVANYEQSIIASLVKNIRTSDDGKTVVVLDETGAPIKNKTTLMPETLDNIIVDRLKDIVDPGKKAQGSGTGKDDIIDPNAVEKGKFVAVPADVTTKVQLSAYLLKLGYVNGSPDFDKILEEHGKNLKLR